MENKIALPIEHLTDRELSFYKTYKQQSGHPLSPTKQAQFFELYLNGKTLDEIHRTNPAIPFGAIVMACVDGDWHSRRVSHVDSLLNAIRGRLQQIQVESVGFIVDALAVTHKLYGDAFQRFLQTGDKKELEGFEISSLNQYKTALQVLQILTGRDPNKGVSPDSIGDTAQTHSESFKDHEDGPASVRTIDSSGWSPKVAGKILEAIEVEGEDI